MNFHENYERIIEVKNDSDRRFGFIFSGLFLGFAVLSFYKDEEFPTALSFLSLLFFLLAFLAPKSLALPNKLWQRFGVLLNKFISPIVLAAIFYFVFFPISLILKIFGKDLLDLKNKTAKSTFWHSVTDTDTDLTSMKEQF